MKIHAFKRWVLYLNTYFPERDKAETRCARFVLGSRTNLRLDRRGSTCKLCARA